MSDNSSFLAYTATLMGPDQCSATLVRTPIRLVVIWVTNVDVFLIDDIDRRPDIGHIISASNPAFRPVSGTSWFIRIGWFPVIKVDIGDTLG